MGQLLILAVYQSISPPCQGYSSDLYHQIWVSLNYPGLNCMGPLLRRFFGINAVQFYHCIFSYGFLNTIFSSLASFILRMRDVIRITHNICVSRLLMFPVRFLVNSRLLFIFRGFKSYMQTSCCMRGSVP